MLIFKLLTNIKEKKEGVQASHLSQNKKSLSGFCIYEPRRGLEGASPTPSFDT